MVAPTRSDAVVDRRPYPVWCVAILAILGLVIIGAHIELTSGVPYYFGWDSSVIYGRDALLMVDGQLPEHILHPNLGNLLVHRFTLPLGHALGFISADSMSKVMSGLNPYLPFAEAVAFLIRQSLWVNMLSVLCLWIGLRRLFASCPLHWRCAYDVLLLALCGSLPGLATMAPLIRSETYGFLFISVAVACVVYAAFSAAHARAALLAGLAGCFAGLAYFSKITLVGYVGALPVFYLLVRWTVERHGNRHMTGSATPVRLLVAVGVAVSLGLTAAVGASVVYFGELPQVATWTPREYYFSGGYSSFHPFYFVIVCMLSLIGYLGWFGRRASDTTTYVRVQLLAVYSFMFFAALLTHYLLYTTPTVATFHLLHTVRNSLWQIFGTPTTHIAAKLSFPVESFFVLSYLAVLSLLAARVMAWNVIRVRDLIVTGMFVGFIVLYVRFVARPVDIHDGMFRPGIALLLLVLVVRQIIVYALPGMKTYSLTFGAVCFAALLSLFAGMWMRQERDYLYAGSYMYEVDPWMGFSYGPERGSRWVEQMRARYAGAGQWRAAFGFAAQELSTFPLLLRQTFVGQRMDLLSTSQMVVGNPAWKDAPHLRFKSYPAEAEAAATIDATYPGRGMASAVTGVRPRPDFKLYALVTAERRASWLRALGSAAVDTDETVVLGGARRDGSPGVASDEVVRLHAILIRESSTLPPVEERGRHLFVMSRR